MTLKDAQEKIEDVMEIIDTTFLKTHLIEVEKAYQHDKSTINQIRLGIIYHEVALNFGFFDKVYKGYPQKSLDMLNAALPKLNDNLAIFKPFVLSYKASSHASSAKLNQLATKYIRSILSKPTGGRPFPVFG
jgi:hypothetical protein